MSIFGKMFAPQEVKAALGVLDEAACTYGAYADAFACVRKRVEPLITTEPQTFAKFIRDERLRVRAWVYSAISNAAGDEVESGHHHVYRGMLGPLGSRLLAIYDSATDELVTMGHADADYAMAQKNALREQIKSVG